MGVPVEHRIGPVAIDRLLEAARAQERIDLDGLTVHGGADGRVMEHRHAAPRAQPGERRFELERLLDRGGHERLHRAFAPRLQRAGPESSREALGPREAHALHLDRGAVQHRDAGRVGQDPGHLVGGTGFEIMVAEHRDLRQLRRAELLGEDARLLRGAVVREVAAEDEHVRALRDLREERLEGALRASGYSAGRRRRRREATDVMGGGGCNPHARVRPRQTPCYRQSAARSHPGRKLLPGRFASPRPPGRAVSPEARSAPKPSRNRPHRAACVNSH